MAKLPGVEFESGTGTPAGFEVPFLDPKTMKNEGFNPYKYGL